MHYVTAKGILSAKNGMNLYRIFRNLAQLQETTPQTSYHRKNSRPY